MGERFLAWRRSAVYSLGRTGDVRQGRLQADLPLTLADLQNAADTCGGATAFELVGPVDVAGLLPAAIKSRMPAPGTHDAIETKAVQIEFAADDLSWRYTPATATASQSLRPWLVLVVGKPGLEVELRPGGRVRLSGAVLSSHPLTQSALWAHVHDLPSGKIARLLSPRDLDGDQDYVAALVPAFRLDDNPVPSLVDAWTPTSTSVELPCYDSWTFRTGPEEDFAQLARKLEPRSAGDVPGFAVATVRYSFLDRSRASIELGVNAALMRVPSSGATTESPALDGNIRAELAALVSSGRTYQGRWVLTLPRYDEPWPQPPAPAAGWRDELAADPRRRGAAGLGAWAAIDWQQRIADAAAAQAGAMALAAQRIRHLTLGLAATRSTWNRRLPADPVARLAVLGVSLARLPAAGGSALDAIDGRTPRMVAALFSSAAQRVLRSGPARTAWASPGANRFAAVLAAANRCPPDPPRDELLERLARGGHDGHDRGPGPEAMRDLLEDARRRAADERPALDVLLDRLPAWLREGRLPPPLAFLDALDPGGDRRPALHALAREIDALPREPDARSVAALAEFAEGARDVARPRARRVRCRPVDLPELGRRVAAAMDPTVARPLVVERVLSTLKGLKPPLLAPPELEPELDLPLWKFLDERARDWLLPGVGTLPPHSVVAVQSNPVFVEAFLLGANHQTLAELRWRNLPVATGWTPMRRFWQRIALARPGTPDGPAPDIRPVAQWSETTPLGSLLHWVDPANAAQLVIVFRTQLFRRFPATVVYLTPAAPGAAGAPDWNVVPALDAASTPRVHPTMTGAAGEDVVFFGFPVVPAAGGDHWVVLEEPPQGFRFYTEFPRPDTCDEADLQARAATAQDSAMYAKTRYAPPVRVVLGNLLS